VSCDLFYEYDPLRPLNRSHVGLLGELDFSELFSLGHHVLVLDTHNTTTPLSLEVGVLVELGVEGSLEGIEILHVFLLDLGESDASGGLGVAKLTELGLTLDEAVWDSLGSAESWEEDHDFSWVDIVGHDDELGLTFFAEGGDVVETEFKVDWLWSSIGLLGFSLGLESILLLFLGLWGVLSEELEELTGLVLVNGVSELSKHWWGLQSLHHDSLLSLDSDILWPLDESGEVFLWLDITTDSEVSWALLEEGRSTGSSSTAGGDDLTLLDNFLWHF